MHATGQQRARRTPLGASGHPLSQALMPPHGVEVRDVLPEDTSQMGIAQDENLVQALAPHAVLFGDLGTAPGSPSSWPVDTTALPSQHR